MPNVLTSKFQGSPCNLNWYHALTTTTVHKDLECSVYFCEVKTLDDATHSKRMFPTTLVTNLECKRTAHYLPINNKLNEYDVVAHSLVDLSMSDELDPRCLETKIPSATFSFKVEGITATTSLDILDEILESFDGKLIRIYRGFASHEGSIYNSNGQYDLDYFSDFEHDTVCMGNYRIMERQFNYEKQTFVINCEQVFFSVFADQETYLARTKTGSDLDQVYQRYPYPYDSEILSDAGDPTHYIYRTTSFKLGYSVWEMLASQTTVNLGNEDVPLYGWAFSDVLEAYGVYSRYIAAGTYEGNTPPSHRYFYSASSMLKQGVGNGQTVPTPFEVTADGSSLADLCYNWKKEDALSSINTFYLFNNLRAVPYRPLTNEPEEARTHDNVPGTWRVVGGLEPDDQNVFLDDANATTWNEANQGTNGYTFPSVVNQPYKVTPNMLLSQTVEKQTIEWEEVSYLKTYYLDLLTTRHNPTTETVSLQNQIYFTNNIDVYDWQSPGSNQPYPSNQNTGFQIINRQPMPDNTWYYPLYSALTMTGNSLDMFGPDMPARALMGGVNSPIRGGNILSFSVLWNTNLTHGAFNNKQPYSLTFYKQDATTFFYDVNGNTIDESTAQNQKGIDTIHAYTYLNGLSHRVINRANLGDTGVNPLYQLTWTMVDDPSLRIGTAVWVPLQNEYIKVYITRQDRTFDGGARLTCSGWAYERAGVPVYDPTLTNAIAHHYVVDPENTPKGEWLRFTWEKQEEWDTTQLIFYEFWYTPDVGEKVLLGSITKMGIDENVQMYNIPHLEEQLGTSLSIDDEGGTYSIKAYFPAFGMNSETNCLFDAIPWNNVEFSEIHANEIQASNEHQPLMYNKLLRG